ncbi:Transcription-repair-coupling factor [Candidatus Rhabdochlamydia oedothoracis]|uniref:Transcription-repair-coupling factor n=1 Tax=Candidatus Rhabdochlamydia oedothoracis TaxID=2720720 RepID=A0ABX8V8I2_9BACT|nr:MULTISPECIES: transcription-repair coupling factor [Rhabdochlamydia]KAG6559129.1 Transcription-repair-coupling factor [Candidatus Rhabdochlamydia sp. W815]QYF49343.1 Transcription-repair-coupling factor [Candidatus Rhabdochlamydia oedothoracis]
MALTKRLKEILTTHPLLQEFLDAIVHEPSILIEQLWDGPKAVIIWVLSQIINKHVLIISSGSQDSLLEDMQLFSLPHLCELPAWETLPGEEIAPSSDLMGKRFEVLDSLLENDSPHVVFAPLQAVLQKLPCKETMRTLFQKYRVHQFLDFSLFIKHLELLNYQRANIVSDKGEFAVRGGIIDFFPPSALSPFRIEFFGNEIQEIRSFDPLTQITTEKHTQCWLCPASELTLLQKTQKLTSFLDYLGPNTIVIFNDLLAIEDRLVSLTKMPVLHNRLVLSFQEFFSCVQPLSQIFLSHESAESLSFVQEKPMVYMGQISLQPLQFEMFNQQIQTKRCRHPFIPVAEFFSTLDNQTSIQAEEILQALHRHPHMQVHFICSTLAQKTLWEEKTKTLEKTDFQIGYLSSGFVLKDAKLSLITTAELSHRLKPRRQKWRQSHSVPISEFHELLPGDIVVHFHNGIGRYIGTEKRTNHLGDISEFMVIEYAEKSKLFIPLSQSHLISRYIGTKDKIPTFSQLGSARWQKTRQMAQKAIVGYADQLLRMQAERTVQGGFAYPADSEIMVAFEEDFSFIETEDQINAITAIKQDMQLEIAMDRLICGDVGYGKTEVAMRAAFKAVCDGHKQVAVLVPTTILAMQHYETFCQRMANFPVQIGLACRFCSSSQIKKTLQSLQEGAIDILIGTQRVISQDVRFKNLGLIIIDEEQRFGVRAKERLKTTKIGVDCLTLSATPIPRTLYLSLIGIKKISMINTPPQDRLPIKSIITERNHSVIQNAIARELLRDGQVFFIHNRIETIFQIAKEIQKLAPEARIVVGHGQMSSDEIDAVFHAFKQGEADILVSTTIVENGIDIPNANTILIDRSDTFGIADLYQMRGRVGRWNKPAYAYFLVPTKKQLPEITLKRLEALSLSSGYGGGMKVAMRDLEIRGAGDILGTQQSGQVSSIGFHLYCKLLKKAVNALSNDKAISFTETKMEFSFDALIPDTYINEPTLRMEIYHRFGDATTSQELDTLLVELTDRFGAYPMQILWLYHLTRLRIFASAHQFTLLKFSKMTLTTQQQSGKTTLKKLLALPKITHPKQLEESVIAALKKEFPIKSSRDSLA